MPTINIRHRGRNDTEANWQQANPILLKGEPAYSTDKNNRYKIGDGTSHWDELEYAGYKIGENITETNNTLSITSENVENALGFNPATRDAATIMAPGLMSQIDKVKLNTIEEGANNYVHPNYLERTAGFYKVTVDDEGHVINASTVVKSDITALGIPAQDTTYDAATTSKDGLMSSEDKTKLDGIASGANKYTHPSFTARNAGLYKVTVNNQGHVTNAVAVTKEDITALGIPAQDTNTTYTVATTSKDGLMSSEDKTKLDGIASGANKTVVDSSLSSSSTNPVQNKVINSALAGKVPTSRTVNGKSLSSNIVLSASDVNAIPSSQKGSAGGVATLDSSGFILSSQLPPSVDEILEGYLYNNAFYEDEEHDVEIDAQSSKIYVDLNNNLTYRWSGTAYVEISKSLAIGETSSTAFRGDRGKIAYNHSQAAHARTDATNVADSSTNGNILVNGSQVNVYTHPSYTQRSSGLYKITVDGSGHVSGATAVTKSDITALGIPAQDTNTWTALKGATSSAAGTAGYAPAPSAGASNRYLRSDGTWAVPPDTNTTYSVATTSKDGLMSSEDKTKLDGIASGANKYTHPSYTARNAGFYKITVDGSGHVSGATAVAKSDITALGIPAQDTTYDAATTSEDGLMSSEDKTKLDGIASGANKYTHPSYTQRSSGLYKITVDGSGHVSGATAVTKSDITALGIPAQDTNTTYTVATTSKDGLMSSEDKTKLNGIATGANKTVVDSSLSSSSTNPVQNKVINSALAGKVPTSRTVNGKALTNNITLTASDVSAIPSSQKGTAGGVASLDSSGFILSSQLPPSVDEILEGYLYNNTFYEDEEHDVEIDAQSSKIYVDLSNNLTYRWSGTAYVEISKSLAIGETSSTAYRGDRGKIAYDHSRAAHARTDATNVADSSTNGNILVNGSQVNVYTHPSYTQRSSGLYKITVDNSGHVSGATAVTKSDITALGIPAQDTNTWIALKGATSSAAGTAGYAPAPTAGASNRYLRSDGTWAVPPDTNTTYTVATTSKNGLMSSADKTKLDGIASGANKYTHPSYTARSSGLYKITVDSQGHVSSVSNVTKSDITNLGIPGQDTNTWTAFKGATASTAGAAGYVPAPSAGSATRYFRSDGTWAVPPNTTYSVASTSANGLMSASDKTKLDGIATGANKYTHPSYTAKSSGLYKVTVDSTGHVSATSAVTKADITALGIPGQDTNTTYTLGSFGITATATEINKLDGLTATTAELNYVDGVTSNIQTQLNGKLSTSGTAAAATKLATGRSIGLSTAVSATTQTFDGTGNITIPVNGVKEAYLEWGGRSMSGGFGPLDASLIPELGANRLAFMPASAIEIQYSTNGGSTWATYPSVTDTAKINLFNGNTSNFYIGANSSSGVTKDNYQLRIIFTSNIAKVYTALQKFAIYLSTGGSNGSWCTIDAITKANVDAGKDTWTTFANKVPVAGWSGWNIINVSSLTTYSNNSSQYQKVRFTFGVTSHSSSSQYPGLVVNKILGFGGMGWQIPSTMAGTGRMYTYDASQNVTFPANVKATKFQGATASTSEAGLMSAADKTKLDGIATGANKYTHPSYTAKSSGLYKITVDSSGHVSATTAVSKSDITALGIPGQDTNTTYTVATTSKDGLMSSEDKTKLDGIASGANKYTHPTFTARSAGLYKITVNSNGHVSAATAVAKADITALGIPAQDTRYSAATTSTAGLMSAADKTKLNGIHAGANNIEYSTTQPTGQVIGDYWVKLE